jgi:hypothetical protein
MLLSSLLLLMFVGMLRWLLPTLVILLKVLTFTSPMPALVKLSVLLTLAVTDRWLTTTAQVF